MPVDTHLLQARATVDTEQSAVDAKVGAFESFVDRIEAIRPVENSTPSSVATVAGEQASTKRVTSRDRCREVRRAFEETVRPHSVADLDADESLLTTIRNEFTESIALALAPTTTTTFTPELKRAVLAEASSRRHEAELLYRCLDREGTQLTEATEMVHEVVARVSNADETPLSTLDFDGLRARHETLARHRSRCTRLVRFRQAFLQETSNQALTASLDHRALIQYLYDELPVGYPVLSTTVQVDSLLRECQQTVREHLVRRV